MSNTIDKLTPEQEAMIPVYLERFRKIGLSCGDTNRAAAEEAVRKSYAHIHKTNQSCVKDPEFVWADGPAAGAKLAAQYAKGDLNVTTAEIQAQASMASYGSFEAYWVSTYAFVAEQLPVKKDELVDIAVAIVENCGVFWTFEDIVVMTPKPADLQMKDQKLHSVTGPAMQYPNGEKLFVYDGEVKGSLMEIAIMARVEETKAENVDTEKKTKKTCLKSITARL